jgi:hypothetical protein
VKRERICGLMEMEGVLECDDERERGQEDEEEFLLMRPLRRLKWSLSLGSIDFNI